MNSGPQLTIGAQGDDVRRAQTIFVMMKTLGFEQIDGIFGTVTKNAVIDFQEGAGLPADGVLGNLTWAKLPVVFTSLRQPVCLLALTLPI